MPAMSKYNWDIDRVTEIIRPLQAADELATAQAFTKPTAERGREIHQLCSTAHERLEELIEDLERFGFGSPEIKR